ncbi:MAG: 50S ribosomal protein L11 [Berkelbacteria bacterium GW2011_GWB1_38_5]|uniref:Large ribosomal subunit protein uL11 n=2 Tax=Candidatus Berkelbacteria TaxID=1618330 RepID=A0A0G0IQ47_9BACT|nr:MAG: 50S ribosomal protein L11 [Berkelbacteria bacterium GW2011_GWA1_36_9]KKQ72547.1 MAG: 50S ribosomal protein L11 [Berkelbacteria bacterium GW2011_GWB1_38_5]
MAKRVKTIIKLQAPAGKATPAQPIGPALGQHGLNIMEFVNQFNAQTQQMGDTIVPVEIRVFEDRTFDFILKSPPAPVLLKKAAKIEKGSGVPNREKVGKVTESQIEEIAKIKLPDLNCDSMESAKKIIRGTAKSMGIEVTK